MCASRGLAASPNVSASFGVAVNVWERCVVLAAAPIDVFAARAIVASVKPSDDNFANQRSVLGVGPGLDLTDR